MMSGRLLTLLGLLPLFNYLPSAASSQSVHTGPVSAETLQVLKEDLQMADVLEIVTANVDGQSVFEFFKSKPELYYHTASQDQGKTLMEAYAVLDPASPISGYAMFFAKDSYSLRTIDASVDPFDTRAIESARRLVAIAFDSVAAGENTKLHHLGTQKLDNHRLLEIVVLATPQESFTVRYTLSYE